MFFDFYKLFLQEDEPTFIVVILIQAFGVGYLQSLESLILLVFYDDNYSYFLISFFNYQCDIKVKYLRLFFIIFMAQILSAWSSEEFSTKLGCYRDYFFYVEIFQVNNPLCFTKPFWLPTHVFAFNIYHQVILFRLCLINTYCRPSRTRTTLDNATKTSRTRCNGLRAHRPLYVTGMLQSG